MHADDKRRRKERWLGRSVVLVLLLSGLIFISPRLVSGVARNGATRELLQSISGHPGDSGTIALQVAEIATQVDPRTCANWLVAGRLAETLHMVERSQAIWDELAWRYWAETSSCQVMVPLDNAFWLASTRYFEAQHNWPVAASAYRMLFYLPAALDAQAVSATTYRQTMLKYAQQAWQAEPANERLRLVVAYYHYTNGSACEAIDLLADPTAGSLDPFWNGFAYRARAACAASLGDSHLLRAIYGDGLRADITDAEFVLGAARFADTQADSELRQLLTDLPLTPQYPLTTKVDENWQLAGFTVDPIALGNDPDLSVFLFWSAVPAQSAIDSRNLERVGNIWIERVTVRNALADSGFEWDDLSGKTKELLFQPLYGSPQSAWQRGLDVQRDSWVGQIGLNPREARSGIAWRPVKVIPGHIYLAAGRIHGPAPVVIGCQWMGDDVGSPLRFPYLQAGLAPDEWIQRAALIDAPLGAGSCRFVVINSAPAGSLSVDDLVLVDITRP
jgi:hypothetical protein